MVNDATPELFDSRCEMIVDVTLHTLRCDPELLLCEGLRLIEATRRAVSRLAPASLETFDAHVLPQMREVLLKRFGVIERHLPGSN